MVDQCTEFLEFVIIVGAGGPLKQTDGFRIPGMLFPVSPVVIYSLGFRFQVLLVIGVICHAVRDQCLPCNFFQSDPADAGICSRKKPVGDFL